MPPKKKKVMKKVMKKPKDSLITNNITIQLSNPTRQPRVKVEKKKEFSMSDYLKSLERPMTRNERLNLKYNRDIPVPMKEDNTYLVNKLMEKYEDLLKNVNKNENVEEEEAKDVAGSNFPVATVLPKNYRNAGRPGGLSVEQAKTLLKDAGFQNMGSAKRVYRKKMNRNVPASEVYELLQAKQAEEPKRLNRFDRLQTDSETEEEI
jgi:hypothetical protein